MRGAAGTIEAVLHWIEGAMADTTVHRLVEDWVVGEWLPKQFRQSFHGSQLPLSSGGVFDFDAVSDDREIVANISTSRLKTGPGKHGTGKVHKIRSDIYFLLLAQAARRLILLTEPDMHAWWLKEAARGRVPPEIEFRHVPIPDDLDDALSASRRRASQEVTPSIAPR